MSICYTLSIQNIHSSNCPILAADTLFLSIHIFTQYLNKAEYLISG